MQSRVRVGFVSLYSCTKHRPSSSFAHVAERALHPFIARLPQFSIHGAALQVLRQPVELKEWLLERILRAKFRIFLSALYIGKEERWIVDAIGQALRDNPQLTVRIAADYFRTTRERETENSAFLLSTLLREFPGRIQIALYHTPALRQPLKQLVPPRYNEGWGLWHTKIYGIDNDVLFSGANLSNDYFTNRQDRYLGIPNHQPFADFCEQLLERTANYSYALTAGQFSSHREHPYAVLWPQTNPTLEPHEEELDTFVSKARQAIGQLMYRWVRHRAHAPLGANESMLDTQLRPFLQIGHLGIRDETSLVIPSIFSSLYALHKAGARPVLDWTSGYFSLDPANIERVLDTRASVRIICAAPEANGFFGSRGVSGMIPGGYTLLEKHFYNAAVERSKIGQVQLREWKRQDWTYHAKGIWISPDALEPPSICIIGSSNYGVRSSHRDVEANVLLTTTNPELRLALAAELAHLGLTGYQSGYMVV